MIAIGSTIGGQLGGMYGRRLPPTVLRGVIVVGRHGGRRAAARHLSVRRVARNASGVASSTSQPRVGHVEHVLDQQRPQRRAAARPPSPRAAPRGRRRATSASRSARCGSSTRAAVSAACSSAMPRLPLAPALEPPLARAALLVAALDEAGCRPWSPPAAAR